MRLTVLRQSNDTSRLKNSGHPKATPKTHNDSPQLSCDSKPTSADKKNTRAQNRATHRTAAQHKCPVIPYFPTLCLNRLPSKSGPAKIIRLLIHQLIICLPQVSPHTDTQQTTRTCRLRRLGSEMWPRDGGKLNAWPHPLRDLRQMSPLLEIYTSEP